MKGIGLNLFLTRELFTQVKGNKKLNDFRTLRALVPIRCGPGVQQVPRGSIFQNKASQC